MSCDPARIIDPQSKLATARGLNDETLFNTLSEELGLEKADEDELYAAMDWLGERQQRIESKLAKKHLDNGSLVLYDVTSIYFEGRSCPLAKLGHNRDGKNGKLQIVFGLLCTEQGCPVAVEVFSGDTGDPSTLAEQIKKLRDRFGLEQVILVGDRGLITEAIIREEIRPVQGLEWITALRFSQIRKLVDSGSLQLSLFDEQDLAEMGASSYLHFNMLQVVQRRISPAGVGQQGDKKQSQTSGLFELMKAARYSRAVCKCMVKGLFFIQTLFRLLLLQVPVKVSM